MVVFPVEKTIAAVLKFYPREKTLSVTRDGDVDFERGYDVFQVGNLRDSVMDDALVAGAEHIPADLQCFRTNMVFNTGTAVLILSRCKALKSLQLMRLQLQGLCHICVPPHHLFSLSVKQNSLGLFGLVDLEELVFESGYELCDGDVSRCVYCLPNLKRLSVSWCGSVGPLTAQAVSVKQGLRSLDLE